MRIWENPLGKTSWEQPSNRGLIWEFSGKTAAIKIIIKKKSGRDFYKTAELQAAGLRRCLKAGILLKRCEGEFLWEKREFLEVIMAITGVPRAWAGGHPTKPSEGSSAVG